MAVSKKLKRVVACQGSIQLVTALSVLKYRARESHKPDLEYENYLVVYDLCAPPGQIEEFAAFIKKMAELICPWQAIVYLDPKQLDILSAKLHSSNTSEIFSMVHDLVGTKSADEIFLARNWQFGNQLLINAYRSAEKICYGDSIGVYFSETYFSPMLQRENFKSNKGNGNLKHRLKGTLKSLPSRLRTIIDPQAGLMNLEFDIGYFLLPDILGERPPMVTIIPEKETILEIFKALRSLLSASCVADLRALVSNRSTVILLTSNFSEAGRMTLENEISAYREFLKSQNIPARALLLIKPHPRDDDSKIQKIKVALGDLFSEVVLLNTSHLFFVPFEILLMEVFLDDELTVPEGRKIITFSTACLPLEFLFKAKPVIGFGSDIVERFFNEEYVFDRVRHELDLLSGIQRVSIGS